MSKKDIASYNYEELTEEMNRIGTKSFRGKQIYSWLHEKLVDSFEEMTNLPKNLREKLDEEYEIRQVSVVKRQISKMDPTEKFLFELDDGNMIESVSDEIQLWQFSLYFIAGRLPYGLSFLCIDDRWTGTESYSHQRCYDRFIAIQKITGERVSNVVVMGTGEPLDNYDNFVTVYHI